MKYNSKAHGQSILDALGKLVPGQLLVTCAKNEDDGSAILCIFQKTREELPLSVVSLDLKDAESLAPLLKSFIAAVTPKSRN